MALSGQKTITTAGAAEALGSEPVNGSLTVKALAANTGLIFIGNDGVGNDGAGDVASDTGFQLAAGEQITFEFTGNLANLRLDAAVNGEGVCWIMLSN
jgi:hypothetical protein